MNASSRVYIDVVIIWTMMSFYQQILHSFSCYKVLCIGNLAYAGHLAVYPSTIVYIWCYDCHMFSMFCFSQVLNRMFNVQLMYT